MKREAHPEATAMKIGHQEIRKRGESLDQITELKKEPHNLHCNRREWQTSVGSENTKQPNTAGIGWADN